MEKVEDKQPPYQSKAEIVDPRWKNLYIIGGAAALISAALGIIEVTIETSGSSLTSSPTTVLGWFTLLQSNRLLGLALLGIFESVLFPLSVLMYLAFYPALRQTSASLTLSAFFINLISAVAYLATNIAFSMLSLSNQYATATTDTQRSMLLAAGQAMLATSQGTGFNMAFVLGSVAGLVVSVVMLKSKAFNKPTAIVGIIGNALGIPISVLGPIVGAISGLFLLVWIILVGIRFFQLAISKKRNFHDAQATSTNLETNMHAMAAKDSMRR